ncbi:hypothetical protein ACO0QE_003688 [Hanseniaspora vineae]
MSEEEKAIELVTSQSDSDHTSDTESTISPPLSVEQICSNLKAAFKETDPLTLNTMIELYSNQLIEANVKGCAVTFLECLHEELIAASEELLDAIGWDLPKVLLEFLRIQYMNLELYYVDNMTVPLVMACFSELASRGNAKDLFLMGCELLSEVSYEVELTNLPNFHPAQRTCDLIDRHPAECIVEVKLHFLTELINWCLKNITTQSPSKFLSMAVNSILTYIKRNIKNIFDCSFILRRVYIFVRGYLPPRPSDPSEFDEETESLLQRKLLIFLLTAGLSECLQSPQSAIYKLENFYYTKEILKKEYKVIERLQKFLEIYERIYDLALSFDVDIEQEFAKHCVEESCTIYENLENDSSEYILKLPAVYDIVKKSKEKEIAPDYRGLLLLAGYMHHIKKVKYPANDTFKLSKLVYLFIRVFSLDKVGQSINHTTFVLQSTACNFMWYPLFKYTYMENQNELAKLPSAILQTLYHLIFLKISSSKDKQEKIIYSTLLTRILCVSPDREVYNLAFDTLSSCPLSEIKCILVSILKDLMVRTIDTASLCEQLKKIDISDTAAKEETLDASDTAARKEKPKKAPVLPPRTFLKVTPEHMDKLYAHTVTLIDEIKKSSNADNLTELLAFINFYIRLKPLWNEKHIENIKSKITNELIENDDFKSELPELTFIQISLKAL